MCIIGKEKKKEVARGFHANDMKIIDLE